MVGFVVIVYQGLNSQPSVCQAGTYNHWVLYQIPGPVFFCFLRSLTYNPSLTAPTKCLLRKLPGSMGSSAVEPQPEESIQGTAGGLTVPRAVQQACLRRCQQGRVI